KLETKLNNREREANQMAENLENEKNQLRKKEAENNRLEAQIQRLEGTLQHQQEEVQGLLEQMRELKQHCEGDRDVLNQTLEDQRKQAEQSVNTATQLSAQLLDKSTLSATEDRLSLTQSEVQQLKISLRDFENLVEGYKSQLQKTRLESEEYSLRLEMVEKEAQSDREEMEREVEQGLKQAQARLKEIEMLHEALKRSEDELRENMHIQDRRNTEQNSTLSELRIKIEQQSCKRNLFVLEENMQLKHSIESTERKMEDVSTQNRDLLQVVTKREETIHNTHLRLEERSRECDSLFRQLEQAREEAQKQVDRSLERERQQSLASKELGQLRLSKEH
ncbi:hypothetical protein cypCar_00017217, partial [Cyprinus carpio]